MNTKRLPAKKVRIFDLVYGKYFPGEREQMKESYLITPFGQKVSRVNIVASVIDKFLSDDGNYSTITIDDGSEAIRVKTFREKTELLQEVEVGDLVLVVGKIKEYNGETYINGEIVRKINQPNLEILRKLEILKELLEQKKIVEELKELKEKMGEEEFKEYAKKKYGMNEEALSFIVEESRVKEDYKPKILKIIEELDEGEGIEVGKILEISKLPENIIEREIEELLNSGELFEPRPGILKKVKT
ncbi:MAG: OB-fold nucleic acid binding domain-containing protein [Candidatus Aenigmarchaeota archaeon]|nr:OB-fold nucleic acid binding domain-containing protein [Candidatus Aenigmarchaeota archaeon]